MSNSWRNTEIMGGWILMVLMPCIALDIRFLVSILGFALPLMVLLLPGRMDRLRNAFRDPWFIAIFLFLLLQMAGIFFTSDTQRQWWEMNKRAMMVAFGFYFAATQGFAERTLYKIMRNFAVGLVLASLICLGIALQHYLTNGNAQVFFYHALVRPLDHHAVFFSFFIFSVFVYWFEAARRLALHKRERAAWQIGLLFFAGMIILLSSKMVIVMTGLYLVVQLVRQFKYGKGSARFLLPALVVLITVAALGLTDNPVKKRFLDLASGHLTQFQKDKFSQADYFNGLQFRLFNWRSSVDLLSANHQWSTGVSSGDAQHQLDSSYQAAGIYMGDPSRGDSGFRGFNCHNMFVQALLESGWPALLLLIEMIVSFFWKIASQRNAVAGWFYTSIVLYACVESLLASQFGIVLSILLPALLLHMRKTTGNAFLVARAMNDKSGPHPAGAPGAENDSI